MRERDHFAQADRHVSELKERVNELLLTEQRLVKCKLGL